MFQDLLAHLRPSLVRITEYEQAAQAVAAIEASEARSAAAGPAGLGAIEEEESDSDNSEDNSGSDSDAEGGPPTCASRKLNNVLFCLYSFLQKPERLTSGATQLCKAVVSSLH